MTNNDATRNEVQAMKVYSMLAGIKSRLAIINEGEEGAVPEANDDQRVFAAAIMYIFETVSQGSLDYAAVDFKAKTITYLPIDGEGETADDVVIQL